MLARIAGEVKIMSEEDARAFLAGDEGCYELDRDLEMTKHLGIEVRRPTAPSTTED